MERRHVSGTRVTLARSTVGAAVGARVGAAVGAREVGCDAGPAPGVPTLTRLSRSPTHGPARVAQSSDQRVGEADGRPALPGPRFARFAAAMEAGAASQDQLLPRLQRQMRPAHAVDSSPRIQWLGIGSWALFCAALFVSLLLRPDRASFQLDQIHPRALVSDVRPIVDSMPTTRRLLPAHGQEVASTAPATAPDLDARPADQATRAGLEADHQ
jgi:hypothetical protein